MTEDVRSMTGFTLSLRQIGKDDVQRCGGKGANLGELTQIGARVPPAFCVVADALPHLLRSNGLDEPIAEVVGRLDFEDLNGLEATTAEIRDMIALHYPSPAQIYRLARTTCTDEADGLLISCNALRAHTVVSELEHDLRKPVITSLTATLWGILRAAGIREPVVGYGRLLERL